MLGRRPYGKIGKLLLTMWNDEFAFVEPGTSFAEIAAEYDLDRVELGPDIRACRAIHLDGPLKGETYPYAPVKIGGRISITRRTPSGEVQMTYELVELPSGDEPGKLRLVT